MDKGKQFDVTRTVKLSIILRLLHKLFYIRTIITMDGNETEAINSRKNIELDDS